MNREIFFRDATPEERESVRQSISQHSASNGVNFFTDYEKV